MPGPRGKKQRHGAATELRPQLLGGGLLKRIDFWFLHQKGTLLSGYRESTLRYRSNVHGCATTLIRFQELAMFDSVYKSLDVGVHEVESNTDFTA
jgi:hypothetical protein